METLQSFAAMYLKKLLKSCVDLVYPPICLHCRDTLLQDRELLCETCFDLLELIDVKLHCPACFSIQYCTKKMHCVKCASKKSSLTYIAAAFEYKGAPSTFVKEFKYGNKPYLSQGLGSFMTAQFIQLKWPIPDLIVPVPQSFSRWLTRGYNQAELLSDSIGQLIERPVVKALIRKSDDFSQAGLSLCQRLKLNGKSIYLKKNQNLQDKVILLVDDVLTTGTTLQICAEALLEDYPNSIYALTLCQANPIR